MHQRKRLDLAVVRGGDRQRATLIEALQNRLRQRCALHGVCARAELIQQHERTPVRLRKNAHGICHMRGEGGKRLLNRLLVADVRKHAVKR
ncbi:hypothetical protein SDC9_118774 [bioreactor metagenome]|uniref:Uncharacterized protein n=1 Tax=bioreactor metagenome TaxID=1076179 RepID=A0A645C8A2_9ZZZZ